MFQESQRYSVNIIYILYSMMVKQVHYVIFQGREKTERGMNLEMLTSFASGYGRLNAPAAGSLKSGARSLSAAGNYLHYLVIKL